jgi:hypothetical protein
MGLLLLYIKPNICKRKEPICTNGYNIGRRYVALRKKNKKRNTNLGKRKEPFWVLIRKDGFQPFPRCFRPLPMWTTRPDPTRPWSQPTAVRAPLCPGSSSSLLALRWLHPDFHLRNARGIRICVLQGLVYRIRFYPKQKNCETV